MQKLLWLLLVPFLVSMPAAVSAQSVPERPNIIFIMVDDLGYADLGSYGQKVLQTPHLDRMAAEGMRFTDFYAGGTVCAPTRSVLMTGQHLGHTRVRGNAGQVGGVGPQRRVPLEFEDVTVAQVLKAAGYVTGVTGKWGLGEPETSAVPNLKGFDEWFGYLNQRHAHTYYPEYLWRNQEKVVLEGNLDGRRETYTHDLFTDFALEFIREKKDRPFFLYLAWTVPHKEWEFPEPGPFADRPWDDGAKVYGAMVDRMDRDVGRIMALLKELQLDEHTIVFFCSDNGGVDRWEGIFDSNDPFRGKKGDLWEGGIRSPMLVRWPGVVRAGAESDFPWYHADVLPTLADLTGVNPPPGIDGISVLPTLLGRRQASERMLYWEQYPGRNFEQAVRWGRWKGIRRENPDAVFELYDLAADPGETRDVAADNAAVVSVMEAFMEKEHVPSPNWIRRRDG